MTVRCMVVRGANCFGRNLLNYRHISSTRLTENHADFLSLVGEQGNGSVLLDVIGNVALLSIENSSKRNAISGKIMHKLAHIVDYQMPLLPASVVAIVLRGAGNEAFCAGADFSLVKSLVNTPEKGVQMARFMTETLNRIRQSGLISVCVINGPALGGGAEITTACDFRLMVDREQNFIQFVHAKIGASPGWGGARRLVDIVGRKEALRLCAGSIPINAQEALKVGFIDGVISVSPLKTDDECIVDAVRTFLHPYLVQPYPGSVRAIKSAIAAVEYGSEEESRKVELDMFASRWFGPDNRSALSNK
jgi:ethylmalonyl-CoA/methylmalonyl-CoA decarboxylase